MEKVEEPMLDFSWFDSQIFSDSNKPEMMIRPNPFPLSGESSFWGPT